MRGYVYVLVNSSLPGLVKVGKTSRLPSDRVGELSGATGVPTPFIVAFEQQFADCDAAEAYVHARLEQMGLRQTSNREFFRASPAEVIKIVLNAPGADDAAGAEQNEDDELEISVSPDDDLTLDESSDVEAEPWADLMAEAERHENGADGYLQDRREAYRLYTDAARLGSPQAYAKLGALLLGNDEIKQDVPKALKYLKEATARGYYYAYPTMALLFCITHQEENFHKCTRRFVDERKAKLNHRYENPANNYASALGRLISISRWHGWKLQITDEIRPVAADIRRIYAKLTEMGLEERVRSDVEDWLKQNGM